MSIAARALHGVNVCVIPNPDNEFKPLALRHKPLAFISALLITAKLAAIGIVGLIPAQAELSTITANRIVQLTNAERVNAGLSPLSTNSKLTAAAAEKGRHMLEEDYFAHISPSGVTPWFWIQKHNYSYLVAGENLAINFTEAEDVVSAWLASPSHKANMLHSDYTETGVAAVTGEFQGGTSIVVVHMFGKPNVGAVESQTVESSPPPEPTPLTTLVPSPEPVQSPEAPAPTPLPDTTPPRVPRIAFEETSAASNTARVHITGEAGASAVVLVNGVETNRVVIAENGQVTTKLDLSNFADGRLSLIAYSIDQAGNQSASSSAVSLVKDTVGPELAASELVHIISPAFDSGSAAVLVQSKWISASATEPFTVEAVDELGNKTVLTDLSIAPQFEAESSSDNLHAPARFLQLTRRLAGATVLALMILLSLAVFVKIHIQRPALITHTAAVMVLAGFLFLL